VTPRPSNDNQRPGGLWLRLFFAGLMLLAVIATGQDLIRAAVKWFSG